MWGGVLTAHASPSTGSFIQLPAELIIEDDVCSKLVSSVAFISLRLLETGRSQFVCCWPRYRLEKGSWDSDTTHYKIPKISSASNWIYPGSAAFNKPRVPHERFPEITNIAHSTCMASPQREQWPKTSGTPAAGKLGIGGYWLVQETTCEIREQLNTPSEASESCRRRSKAGATGSTRYPFHAMPDSDRQHVPKIPVRGSSTNFTCNMFID